jgi:hypothetical protein
VRTLHDIKQAAALEAAAGDADAVAALCEEAFQLGRQLGAEKQAHQEITWQEYAARCFEEHLATHIEVQGALLFKVVDGILNDPETGIPPERKAKSRTVAARHLRKWRDRA